MQERGQENSGRDAAEAAGAGEAADNEGFHAGPLASGESAGKDQAGKGGSASESGGPESGGPEDPPEADQSPTGEQDPDQNPPLPRTWN
ncbi:hypothetical protein OL239_18770 [Arthrobacter sp. ATA002]|uniref:hypothetical protein n=1 Tax=Arthrobacter sp. ATA002 TaxID=2991715 RepID=UPI0022A78F60|nr:hypothetical protein [Arthrobacter sp. ATA002]WAP51746.1 hypothetical protein OL239_18770 [Arthrobacter sp. ATA002]